MDPSSVKQENVSKIKGFVVSQKSMWSISLGFALLYGAYISDWLSYRLSSFRVYRPSTIVFSYLQDYIPQFSNVSFTFTDILGHFVIAGAVGYIFVRYVALPVLNITRWSDFGLVLVVGLLLIFNALTVYSHFSSWIFSLSCYGFACGGGFVIFTLIAIIANFFAYAIALLFLRKILQWRENNLQRWPSAMIWFFVVIITTLLLMPNYFWSDLIFDISHILNY